MTAEPLPTVSRRSSGKAWLAAAAISMVLGVALLVGSLMLDGRWWQDGEVTVPRDGESHDVTLSEPGGDYAIWSDQSLIDPECTLVDAGGTPVPVRLVPKAERIYVDHMGVGKPEASFLFSAPQSGSLSITCASIRASPVQTLDLGRAPHRVVFAVMNWGAPLLGLGMLLLGLVVLGMVGVLGPRRRPPSF